MKLHAWTVLLLAIALLACAPRADAACTVSMPDVAFGSVDVLAGQNVDITGNLTIDCTGYSALYPYVRVCLSIGVPSGGGTVDNRLLKGAGANALKYNLYTDAARSKVWGSTYLSQPPMVVDVPISWGNGQSTVPFYGRVAGGQANVPAGSYSIAFGANEVEFTAQAYVAGSPPATCSGAIQADDLFNVTAAVTPVCSLSASNIDFGQLGTLGANTTAAGVVNVTCSYNLPYSLSLSAGQGAGADVATRKMTRSGGAETIAYRLYTDSARTQPWGDGNAGTSFVYGQGFGAQVGHTVYALLPAQASQPAGTYNDTILVTVSY